MEATALSRQRPQKVKYPAFAREIILQSVYLLLGLLVSGTGIMGDISPFPAALAASIPLKYTPAAVVGSVFGYILHSQRDGFRYIAVLLAIAGLKWFLYDIKKLSASRFFAPMLAFIPLLSTGVVMLFVSTSTMSSFSLCLIEATVSAVSGYFLSRTLSLCSSVRAINTFTKQELACLGVSGCILIVSLGSVEIFSVSLGRFLAIAVILMFAYYSGVSLSTVSATALGVMFSLGSTKMAFISGCFALGGLVAGFLKNSGKLSVGVGFMLSFVSLAFASQDKSLVLSLFIEALLATGVFMLIPIRIGNGIRALFIKEIRKTDSSDYLRQGVVARLEHASRAVTSVSGCVSEVAEKLGNGIHSVSDFVIYENAAEKTCRNCGLKVYCWDRQKEVTRDDFRKLTDTLREDGYIKDTTIDLTFSKKCCKQRELAQSINRSYQEYLAALSAKRRITQVRSVVAGQFSGLGEMLSDLSEDFQNVDSFDVECGERITEQLRENSFSVINTICRLDSSNRMVVEIVFARTRGNIDTKEVHRIVSVASGRNFELPEESFERDRLRLCLSELCPYDVEIGSSQHIAGNGSLCGDSYDYFLSGTGSMVAILSDGMGTGGAAAVDANMAVSILKKLVKAGLSYDSSLSVVNASLMVKSEEESTATLDVAEMNLFTGKLSLFKAGAPHTFVCRGGRIHRREGASLPVGILNEAKFAKDTLTLHEGDAVLMLSDGAFFSEDDWIEGAMKSWKEAPASDFASAIVNEAIKRRNDGHDDDITAVAFRLLRNEG